MNFGGLKLKIKTKKMKTIPDEPINGLTKRELFAAMAMEGNLASLSANTTYSAEEAASDAVLCADALIKELNKGNENE